MGEGRRPDFLIVGAPRCGTTTMYEALRRHPEIFMPDDKEPLFFLVKDREPFRGPGDPEGVRTWEAYEALFEDAREERIAGEASTLYLYSEHAAEQIAEHLPDAKLLVVLRNPAERAWSNFVHKHEHGETLDSFERALEAEPDRQADGWIPYWYYRDLGFYAQQLEQYLERFDPEQIRVHLFEDLVDDQKAVLRDVLGWLGVDPDVDVSISLRRNVSGFDKEDRLSRALRGFLERSSRFKSALKVLVPERWEEPLWRRLTQSTVEKPPMPSHARRRLIEGYRRDIEQLEELIDRDLSGWLEEAGTSRNR